MEPLPSARCRNDVKVRPLWRCTAGGVPAGGRYICLVASVVGAAASASCSSDGSSSATSIGDRSAASVDPNPALTAAPSPTSTIPPTAERVDLAVDRASAGPSRGARSHAGLGRRADRRRRSQRTHRVRRFRGRLHHASRRHRRGQPHIAGGLRVRWCVVAGRPVRRVPRLAPRHQRRRRDLHRACRRHRGRGT